MPVFGIVVKKPSEPPPPEILYSNASYTDKDFDVADQYSFWWNGGGGHQADGGSITWGDWQDTDGYVLMDGGNGSDGSYAKLDTITATTSLFGNSGRSVITIPIIIDTLGDFTNTGTGLTTDKQCIQFQFLKDPGTPYQNYRGLNIAIGANGIFIQQNDGTWPQYYSGSIQVAETTWNWNYWTFDWNYGLSTDTVDIYRNGVKLVDAAPTRNGVDNTSGFQIMRLQAFSRLEADNCFYYMDYVKIGSDFA